MKKILSQKFFRRPTLEVAHDLLGKFLVCKVNKVPSIKRGGEPLASRGVLKQVKEIAVMITEVEAYDGPHDKASHASRGMTERNAIMFAEGGNFYVYLCYGMYEMLNIVTGKKDYPAAILLRGAIFPLLEGGIKGGKKSPLSIRPRRTKEGWTGCVKSGGEVINLNGPGKLTKFLKINRFVNKKPAIKTTGLWFEDRGVKIPEKLIKRTPRIGVDYAGPVWKNKKFRFLVNSPLKRGVAPT